MLKKKLGSLILASMILLSSTAFVFADETKTGEEIEGVQTKEISEETANGKWFKIGDYHYYMLENGDFARGWNEIDGKMYYFWYSSGKMAEGLSVIGSKGEHIYITKENGIHRGITKLENGDTYYFDDNGIGKEAKIKQGDTVYYFNKNGKLYQKGKSYISNASAYSGHSTTATGQKPRFGTIAVDPKVIPYGTKVYIPYFDKVFVANDCGGAIKGTKIDIYMNSSKECYKFGRRNIEIVVLEDIK